MLKKYVLIIIVLISMLFMLSSVVAMDNCDDNLASSSYENITTSIDSNLLMVDEFNDDSDAIKNKDMLNNKELLKSVNSKDILGNS